MKVSIPQAGIRPFSHGIAKTFAHDSNRFQSLKREFGHLARQLSQYERISSQLFQSLKREFGLLASAIRLEAP